jgi:hypothetical protein
MLTSEEACLMMPSYQAGLILRKLEDLISEAAQSDKGSCQIGPDIMDWSGLNTTVWSVVHSRLTVAGYGTQWHSPAILEIWWVGP